MIQDVVIEAIGREEVAAVVGFVQRPVVAQALGHQHEHTVVPELVVLDDRERLERLTEADAVGDDAATVALELGYRADHAITLKPVELLPDHRVADASGRLDDALFVEILTTVAEEVMQDERVDEERVTVCCERLEVADQVGLCTGVGL